MLTFNYKYPNNYKLLKYVNEQTNKWIKGLQEKDISIDLVKSTNLNQIPQNIYLILPFVSFISFLAGYKIYYLIQK